MKITVVGCGKVGTTLVEHLTREGHDVTVIDIDVNAVNAIAERYDVLGIVGNGATFEVQSEAGVKTSDILIAVTNSDEQNLLCCLIAKKVGVRHTIGRVRDPIYNSEINYLQKELGLALVINPELATAKEIARLLRYPSAITVDTFAGGNVELLIVKVEKDSVLNGVKMKNIYSKLKCDVLICSIERNDDVFIPSGESEILEGDRISFVASPKNVAAFLRKIGQNVGTVKNAMLIGGGDISRYLAEILNASGIDVKIIEKNKEKCIALANEFSDVSIINGDGMEQDLLLEEGLDAKGGFVALTNSDEENIIMSLYAKSLGRSKIITKLSRLKIDGVVKNLGLDCFISPKNITANIILRYVRAMKNSAGSNVEALYRLSDERVEALEFSVKEGSPVIGKPLSELRIKKGILVACITRGSGIIIPKGNDEILAGDSVIVVTKEGNLLDVADILN